MSPPDFERIERELHIMLPEDYKALLADYPAAIAAAKDMALSDDAEWIIAINLGVREDPLMFFGKQSWQPHHLVIGEDGSGNCYALNLRRTPSPVLMFHHDDPDQPQGRMVAPTLAAWIPLLQAQLAEDERLAQEYEANMQRQRQQKRPWWKFW